jgi:hypothetical protein
VLPVVEVFWQNHWEPWALLLGDNIEILNVPLFTAYWMLRPVRIRFSDTIDWGGVECCLKRMNKIYNCDLN